MRRVWVVAVVFAAVTLAVPSPTALACSLAGPEPTEAEYLARADVVFEGVAGARRERDPRATLPEPVFYTFTVDRVVKGGVGVTQEVATNASGASCGIVFQEGARYRVYAKDVNGALRTGLGSGTRLASADPSTVPRQAQPPPPTPTPSRRIALTG